MLSQHVIESIEDTLLICDAIIKQIKTVKTQSTMDMIGLNTVVFVKRQGITKINVQLKNLSQCLDALNQKISNLNLQMTYRLSNEDRDVLLDVALDNAMTDYQIHQELETAQFGVERIQGELVKLLPYYTENF